jgi:uncharacterized protein (DUF305 family)
MHRGMAVTTSGDPDVDFARMMIPHHQGAIDMARVELAQGKDPARRAMAQDIIKGGRDRDPKGLAGQAP